MEDVRDCGIRSEAKMSDEEPLPEELAERIAKTPRWKTEKPCAS
jgi:hypothetical protein